jgi:hypothetical protein
MVTRLPGYCCGISFENQKLAQNRRGNSVVSGRMKGAARSMNPNDTSKVLADIIGMAEGRIKIFSVTLHEARALADRVTARRPERQFEVKGEDGKAAVRRLPNLEQAAQRAQRGRPALYDFGDMEVGETRTIELPVDQHQVVRNAVKRVRDRKGWDVVAKASGARVIVQRVGPGNPPVPVGPVRGYGMGALQPGQHIDIPSSPDLVVANVRRRATYYSRKIGARLTVTVNELGGCRITRSTTPATASAKPTPRVRTIPQLSTFDEEEF